MERYETSREQPDIGVMQCFGGSSLLVCPKDEARQIIGLELDPKLLQISRNEAKARELNDIVEFQPAQKEYIPFPDHTFDGLVSERGSASRTASSL